MTAPEVRAGCEFRVAGRTLSGRVMTYGDISPEHRERFLSGAFGPAPSAPLNIQHDRNMIVLGAGDYALTDTERELRIRAELSPGSAALELVRRGALNGYSVEFHARAERREAGVRIIEQAALVGIGLVDQPAYPDSLAEVRRGGGGGRGSRGGRLGSFRGRIPIGKRLSCRCGPGNCTQAIFKQGAFDSLFDEEDVREVLAVAGDYSNAIASRKRKTVRFWEGKNGDLEFAVDVPNTERGKALMETFDVTDIYARPVIDVNASDVKIDGGLAEYSQARVRALTLGATDASDGWTPLRLADDIDDEFSPATSTAEKIAALSNISQRRAKLWLL